MSTQLKLSFFASLLLFSHFSHSALVTYDNVDFPQGDASFIDEVVSYIPGPDVARNSPYDQPQNLLGAPDNAGVSIGDGGTMILRFIDNVLIADGTSDADLWIFEIGPAIEWFNMEISIDGIDWIFVGNVRGQPSGIDIDAVNGVSATAEYSWLRLTDDITRNDSGSPYGEGDFDSIGAISSRASSPNNPTAVNAPLVSGLFGLFWLITMRRKLRE